jgi:hypothetical protein
MLKHVSELVIPIFCQMREQLAAAGKENKELLGICNELLSQVEKGNKGASK